MSSPPKISAPNRLIEKDEFPFEFISALAEKESWRKEIYRPIYHIHKWWAKRLGSVFRGLLLGCMLPENEDLRAQFYQQHEFKGVSVFDPFMGSGTTVGEAHKLGLTALGRDINPVACESVRVALGPLDRSRLQEAFLNLSETVGPRIRELYQTVDEKGDKSEVLYYFWVKNLLCPHCQSRVDLFGNRIVASNAAPDRRPEIQVSCPQCGLIFPTLNSITRINCPDCGLEFNPHLGPARGIHAACPACRETFSILETTRLLKRPPEHRLYGKLILTARGEKKYLAATPADLEAYAQCSLILKRELKQKAIRLPQSALRDGHNTRQAMSYNYLTWRDFFNDRQLLALGWLQEAISRLDDVPARDALLTLFSGVLEFNNLFASYKGEGTGAVRHMFAHHILKPERTPLEANVWGTPKSSGSFSNLFKGRLLRALDYREHPVEVALDGPFKKRRSSSAFSGEVSAWPQSGKFSPNTIYLSCGSSDQTNLPNHCIEIVVTDPPFFDNVHYSELADFFYAWQVLYPRGFISPETTTRHPREVQDTDPEKFALKLRSVFQECHRLLKDDGLLAFTYHHSRSEGWSALAAAVIGAGFSMVNAHPVKAEMSVAAPKAQAKEPIQLDVIMVCRKREQDRRKALPLETAAENAISRAETKISRLAGIGLKLSLNDYRIIVLSQFLAVLGPLPSTEKAIGALNLYQDRLEAAALRLSNMAPETDSPITQVQNGQIHLPF